MHVAIGISSCLQTELQCIQPTYASTSHGGKGCRFALGSHGVYFGGKDIIVSEVSGSWAVKAETGLVDKKGNKGARLTLQIGVPQPPPPARQAQNLALPLSHNALWMQAEQHVSNGVRWYTGSTVKLSKSWTAAENGGRQRKWQACSSVSGVLTSRLQSQDCVAQEVTLPCRSWHICDGMPAHVLIDKVVR